MLHIWRDRASQARDTPRRISGWSADELMHADLLAVAHAAAARHAWGEAFEHFEAAGSAGELAVRDLESMAMAAHMSGRIDAASRAWERAHLAAIRGGDPLRAARHAFQLVMGFGLRGESAQAGGWLVRAAGLVASVGHDSVERGYLLIPRALRALDGGDPAAALDLFGEAGGIAAAFRDPDLATMSRLGLGQSRIALGDTEAGVALLDEAMVAVTTGEVSPIFIGIVYCASIEAFIALFDLRRAHEWTAALSAWCEAQPDLVPFRGRCLVYRAELMQFHGSWVDAEVEVQRAHAWLSRPPVEPALGEALYQQAELHRLRGEHAAAEADYREASQLGRRPEPGLALMRAAHGDPAAAAASIRRAVDEADALTRPRLLEASVEILLQTGDIEAAREAAADLAAAASRSGAPLLRAMAARADGRIRLADGDARGASAVLREAWGLWHGLDAPYEVARSRVLLGDACRRLGDTDTAELEFDAARRGFRELGAVVDLQRLDAPSMGSAGSRHRIGPLSVRETEVVRLVAGGLTNRAIAADLGISERTVDRHVSNIYTKLDVTSRASATAWAIEHGLR